MPAAQQPLLPQSSNARAAEPPQYTVQSVRERVHFLQQQRLSTALREKLLKLEQYKWSLLELKFEFIVCVFLPILFFYIEISRKRSIGCCDINMEHIYLLNGTQHTLAQFEQALQDDYGVTLDYTQNCFGEFSNVLLDDGYDFHFRLSDEIFCVRACNGGDFEIQHNTRTRITTVLVTLGWTLHIYFAYYSYALLAATARDLALYRIRLRAYASVWQLLRAQWRHLTTFVLYMAFSIWTVSGF